MHFIQDSLRINNDFSFQNDLLPEGTISGQNQHGYKIRRVDRFDAGRYTCRADNGVGTPATAQIDLQVLCECF